MTKELLVMDVTYPISTPTNFKIEGNVKPEMQADLISDFLLSQMGAGADNSKPNEHEEYKIRIELDLSDDSFKVSSNTGNKGLRDGILMDVVRRLGSK